TICVVVENSDVLAGAGCGNTELQSAKFFRRKSAIGVFLTGPEPRALSALSADRVNGVRRAQTTSPDRHSASSHVGSYSTMRAGNSSPSHAAAGASTPS